MNRARRKRVIAGCVALVAAASVPLAVVPLADAASAAPAAPSQTTAPSRPGGLIAYANGDDLHTVHSDGSGTKLLTTDGPCWDDPAWSADGTKIAFACSSIYTMRADGTHLTRLTKWWDGNPSWSPDGRQLVFDRYLSKGGRSAIFRINADGSGLTRLTRWATQRLDPAWSPDGSKIAYVQGFDITLMNPDGSGKTPVPNLPPDAFEPAWSPNGDQIAFAGGNACDDIFTVNVDGSGLANLTRDSCQNTPTSYRPGNSNPSWSPDGTQIVFDRSDPHGDTALIRMNSDGSQPSRLTNWSAQAHNPSWGVAAPWCARHSATITGTARDDTLRGTPGADVIVGRGGADAISGGRGSDIVCGGSGADTIFGETGNDAIFGNAGNDKLHGGRGNDALRGGGGTDKLYGGFGTDKLHQ